MFLHVEPRPGGRWIVRRDDDADPVSQHGDAEAASEAAIERAGAEGEAEVLLHDLYLRVRPVVARRRR